MGNEAPYAVTQVGQPRIPGVVFLGPETRKRVDAERDARNEIVKSLAHLSLEQLEDIKDVVDRISSEESDG